MISKDGESGPSRFFYEENGLDYTKALLSALGDRGKELGLDTLGGFLSGLFLSGAKSGYNAIQFNRMGQEAFDTGSYQDYISLGLLADHDSEAYRYAEEIRAKLNAGREVTNIEMGQLTAAVYADALGVGEKRTTETREDMDEDIWDRVFNEEDASTYGAKLTSTENQGIIGVNQETSTTMQLPDIPIGRSLGAKAQNYDIMDLETGEHFQLVEGTHLQNVEVFAGKGTKSEYRNAEKYATDIGGRAADWQHVKGVGAVDYYGESRKASIHWSQCENYGKYDFFIKEWLE